MIPLFPRRGAGATPLAAAFVLLWWLGFFVYPLWHVPLDEAEPRWIRLALAGALFAAWLFNAWLFVWMRGAAERAGDAGRGGGETQDGAFWAAVLSCATVMHLPFLFQPVISGLDMIDHAAAPALVADRVADKASSLAGFGIQPLLTAFGTAAAAAIAIPPLRRRIAELAKGWFESAARRLWAFMAVLGIAAVGWIGLVYAFDPLAQFGDLDTLFRYPPLSKLIIVPLYAVFGLHEWLGRVVQLAFFYGGAWYLYRLTGLYAGRDASRMAAMLFLLSPPLFHYGNTHLLEGGTLFFVTAAFFYWMRYLDTFDGGHLAAGTFMATAGCLYKHPAVGVIPAFALMCLYDAWTRRRERRPLAYLPAAAAVAIPAVTAWIYLKLSSFNKDVPSDLAFPTPDRLLSNLAAVPLGVTLPVALVFAAGMVYLGGRRDRRLFVLLLCWILPHHLLSSMSLVYENVRQALPYYVGLMVAGAVFLEAVFAGRKAWRIGFLYGLFPAYLVWACLFYDRNQDHRIVGRAMGDRSYINFSTWNDSYIPYGAIMKDLRERTAPGDTIYAPMGNEPSHFYLAKYGLLDREYIRDTGLWGERGEHTLDGLAELCGRLGCDWLLAPRGKWLYQYVDPSILEPLFENAHPRFRLVTVYRYGDVEAGLWRFVPAERR